MRKIFTLIVSVLIVVGVFYGMKQYTNKYKYNNSEKIIENNTKDEVKEGAKEATDISKVDNEIDYNEKSNFTLPDLKEKEVSLSDYKGKKVFLNFWATWCPPCRGEMPDMNKLHAELEDSEVVILAVNIGEEKDKAEKFINNNKFNFKVLLDTKTEIGAQYGVSGIPTSILIDENGNQLKRVTGAMTLKQMKDFINK